MSQDLIKARKLLSSVGSHLKQGKYMPAAQAISDAALLVLKTGTIKAEKDEFGLLFDKAVYTLNHNAEFRQIYPLVVSYSPGEEKPLLIAMKDVLKSLQDHITEGVKKDAAEIEALKNAEIEKGQNHLNSDESNEARKVFNGLLKRFKSDTDLKADIADRYLRAELYEDAFSLLEEALEHDPQAIFLYNRIGIVLRRMGEFDTAEKYYHKALVICTTDEYLYFNMGRLYYDWKKWEPMRDAAIKALEINPDFSEALKMKQFAIKKMG